jgi:hypothetical protein
MRAPSVALALLAPFLPRPAAAAPPPLAVAERLRVFPESAPVALTLETKGAGPAALALARRGPSGDQALGDRPLAWKDGRATLGLGRLPRGYYELRDPVAPDALPLAFVVTFDPAARPAVDRSLARIATDGAIAWLVKPGDFDAVSQAMALSGAAWVRDRLSWAEVAPARGEFKWADRYDRAADAQRKAGLSVVTVFHDIPGWARADHDRKAFPENLKDAFDFGKALAEHFRGRIQAYEVWNEADIEVFATEPADRLAAFHKAAALGIQAGDPKALVLFNSFATQAKAFGELYFENEVGTYAAACNHHLYQPPDKHPSVARWHFELARRFGLGLPFWVTEAGVALPDADGRLREADRWKQADFVAKSYARSLDAGIDRHFFFIFPYYKEGTVDFGLLDRDLAPTPGTAAFATMSFALGNALRLGKGIAGADDVAAMFFDAGPWRAAVVWRDAGPKEVALPTSDPAPRGLTVTGEEIPLKAEGGAVRLAVGPSPVYVLAKDLKPAVGHAQADPVPPLPEPGLKETVVRIGLPRPLASFKRQRYVSEAGAVQDAEVEVWHFGAAPLKGTLKLACASVDPVKDAPMIRLEPAEAPVDVAPMGVARIPVKLRVPPEGLSGLCRVTARVAAGDRSTAAACVRVAAEAKGAAARVVSALPLDPAAWAANISGNGTSKLTAAEGGGLRIESVFTQPGDRWSYPVLAFNPPKDLSACTGLRLRVKVVQAAEGLTLRVQVAEPAGASYLTQDGMRPKAGEVTEWMVPFAELEHGAFSGEDPNGKLDVDRVARILVGVNQAGERSVFEILSMEAVTAK